jgi:hypothetical protein
MYDTAQTLQIKSAMVAPARASRPAPGRRIDFA